MKSAAKVPFKGKKTPYNLNEVDVNLLLKNPSHIRKVVKGNYKEENNYDKDESEEEEEGEDDKLESHMKRYITEYFDNKYNKEKDQRKKMKRAKDIMSEVMPFGKIATWETDMHRKTREYREKNPTTGKSLRQILKEDLKILLDKDK